MLDEHSKLNFFSVFTWLATFKQELDNAFSGKFDSCQLTQKESNLQEMNEL